MYNTYMYADISVVSYGKKDLATFTYEVSGYESLAIGSVVKVKFGKKPSFGIIRNLYNQKPRTKFKISKIESVLNLDPLPKSLLSLSDWMVDYYVATASSVWQLMMPKNPATTPRKAFDRPNTKTKPLVTLSQAQAKALSEINQSSKPTLLEGSMGSGKTEIYFHLIKQAIGQKKSAILLMPEIFLTTQMIERARRHFGSKLLITHSSMTPAERRAFWVECSHRSKSEGLVVLGPRSSLFSPLHNLSLIIIDECHEQSYKQDSSPRYQTEYVAAKLASLSKSKLVLGSATPSVVTRYMAEIGRLGHVKLSQRAIKSIHPSISIVQLDKLSEIQTKELETALDTTIGADKSSLLYINRRGNAPIYMCNDCGHTFECPHCGINLHLHADSMSLVCHVCSYRQTPPAECPECGNTNLRGIGIGTKEVERVLREKLTKAKIIRIDRDSAKSSDYSDVFSSEAEPFDIIVGTQMVGRGIDLENLHLVGIINADYDLLNVDYNSRERAFQLISQTAGRAGRRETQGEVIIQTKNPENTFFEYIKKNDYDGFYKDELKLRKKYSYPPYSYLLKLECGYKNKSLGKTKCQELVASLHNKYKVQVLGPVPSHPHIKNGSYFWKLIIKSKNRSELVGIAKSVDGHWVSNLDPFGIS
jgi:primosomal protein N' (replication factor Y)